MSAFLLLSIYVPDVDTASCDPERLAEELIDIINADRSANGLEAVGVGLFPSCEWLTAETFERLKAAAATLGKDDEP